MKDMAENSKNFDGTVQSLFDGMQSFLSTKTVVGDAVNIDGTIILPLVDVSFGMGAGSKKGEGKEASNGGMGAKMSPSAVLVIKDGQTKLVNIKNQDAVTKIIDMVPDIIDRFKNKDKEELSKEDIIEAVKEEQ